MASVDVQRENYSDRRRRSTLGCKPDAQFCHFRAFRGRLFRGQKREAAAELTVPADMVVIDSSRKRNAGYLFYGEKCEEIPPALLSVSRARYSTSMAITHLY